jgi:hypothetical protein
MRRSDTGNLRRALSGEPRSQKRLLFLIFAAFRSVESVRPCATSGGFARLFSRRQAGRLPHKNRRRTGLKQVKTGHEQGVKRIQEVASPARNLAGDRGAGEWRHKALANLSDL